MDDAVIALKIRDVLAHARFGIEGPPNDARALETKLNVVSCTKAHLKLYTDMSIRVGHDHEATRDRCRINYRTDDKI